MGTAEHKCSQCGFISRSADGLRMHRSRICNGRVASYQCDRCQVNCSSPIDLRKHSSVCKKTCEFCGKVFCRVDARVKHEEKKHQRNFTGNCNKCHKTFTAKSTLTKHIIGCVLDGPIQFYKFRTKKELEQWVERIELETDSYFSTHGGSVQRQNNIYTYRLCQHNQRLQQPLVSKTGRKRRFGPVPDTSCPAKISIKESDDGFSVKFFSLHNHACSAENLKYQPYPKSLRNGIRTKLAIGITPKTIFEDERDEKWSRENRVDVMELSKVDQLNRRYINQEKAKMKARERGHPDDATATALLVETISKEKYSPVVLYKPIKGDVQIGDGKELSKHSKFDEIFCLGLQTKEQAKMMVDFGQKILCADATHGLTAYNFQLFTLVVKDDTGKGYPVASLITSNVDSLILTCFLKEILKRNPSLQISTTMSDDDDATKAAFRAAFGPTVKTLLCHWHVPLAWKRNWGRMAKEEREEISAKTAIQPVNLPQQLTQQTATKANSIVVTVVGRKRAFVPTPPEKATQLYGSLPRTVSLTQPLFQINGVSVSHLVLKTLETQPSDTDCVLLRDYFRTAMSKSFKPGWLLDETIDAALSILCQQHPQVFALACCEVNMLHSAIIRPQQPRAVKRIGPTVRMVLLPFNASGGHWTLLVYNREKNEFLFFDSDDKKHLSVPDPAVMERLREGLQGFWGEDCQDAEAWPMRCADQGDDRSCGVLVIHYATLVARNRPYGTKCNPVEYRREIFRILVNNKGNAL